MLGSQITSLYNSSDIKSYQLCQYGMNFFSGADLMGHNVYQSLIINTQAVLEIDLFHTDIAVS